MATDDDTRRRLAELLQAEHDAVPETDGAVLLGFACVAEWMAPDGEPWLSVWAADGTARDLPRWRVQGYFHNLLHDPMWNEHEHSDGD